MMTRTTTTAMIHRRRRRRGGTSVGAVGMSLAGCIRCSLDGSRNQQASTPGMGRHMVAAPPLDALALPLAERRPDVLDRGRLLGPDDALVLEQAAPERSDHR